MSIVTRAEFAEICKTTAAIITTNITRKKVSTIPGNKRMIDTENPLNKIFKKNSLALAKRKTAEEKVQKANKKVEEAVNKNDGWKKVVKDIFPETPEDIIDEIFTEEETPTQKRQRLKANEDDEDIVNWDLRKKIADALKAEKAAELAQLNIEKMMGNLMPVDLVESILKVNIQDIFKTFENELINLASIYCDVLAGGNRDKLAEIIAKIRLKLNDTIARIKTNSAQEIENVVESYAETRSRGERK